MDYKELVEADLKHIWHPCSQMKDYEELPPMIIERGEGPYLYGADGTRYIDIISSWWCNLLGHCNPAIGGAVKRQLDRLEHVIFANFSHEPAVELARRLAGLLPEGLSKFHFNDNGSASVECALKMSFQYQLQTGSPRKKRFMCLSGGYHGETLGALSVGAVDLYSKLYKPLLTDAVRIDAPDCYRCPYGGERVGCDCACAASAREAFERHGDEICALIVEPLLQAAAGMRIYPAAYLKELRRLCDEYGALLIADEIATGFGRTGKLFACEHAGISPDIICLSKGITGGYMPFAVTAATDEIYRAFYADYADGKAFMHSHTYSGSLLGCSAALAVLDILQDTPVLDEARQNAPHLTRILRERLDGRKYVGEIRSIGLINAIELVADKRSKAPFDGRLRTGYRIYREALKRGLLLRPLGDVLYFNPPLNIGMEALEEAADICAAAAAEVLGGAGK